MNGRARRSGLASPESFPTASRRRAVSASLGAILLLYIGLASGYALATPRWNNPDEPAHYNYIGHLARTGQLPELRDGDWDSQRLGERLSSGRFTTAEPIDAFRYESHQPPLYYLIMAPFFRLAEGLGSNARVVVLRWGSIGFGLLAIVLVYAAGRSLAPERAELGPLAAGIVAFIPMHTAMTATINNDALAELLASATLLTVVVGLRRGFGSRGAAVIGALSGLLLLTKLTVYVLVPLALLALALGAGGRSGRPFNWSRAGRLFGLALLVASLIAGWWFWRNLSVYGWPDLFGLQRHDQVVLGQPRWPGLGEEQVRFFLFSLFRSFWAQFGWMAVVVDDRFYWLFLLLILLVTGGLARFWRVELPAWPTTSRQGLRFLLAGFGLVVFEVVAYNLVFIQAQGRYLYPALLPIGILSALGWSALAELAPGASRWRWLGFGLGFFWLWAVAIESVAWLVARTPAPLVLHAMTAVQVWFASRIQIRRPRPSLAGYAAAALVVALILVDLAALQRFVRPYFAGW